MALTVFHTETGSHCRLDIHLQAFWRSFQLSSSVWHRDRVLLTGATGYVGAFILKELMQNTEVCFFVVVVSIDMICLLSMHAKYILTIIKK
jgi:NADPH:quinone reductase-like Zn-dependent oxidoreductase